MPTRGTGLREVVDSTGFFTCTSGCGAHGGECAARNQANPPFYPFGVSSGARVEPTGAAQTLLRAAERHPEALCDLKPA